MLSIDRHGRGRAHFASCEEKEHRDGSRDLVHKDHVIHPLPPADATKHRSMRRHDQRRKSCCPASLSAAPSAITC